jgi:hypothetical protein
MHFHLPKPLHGWREFVGEVGIIVVGVLIALSAEQLVENWHWRSEVRESDQRLRAEITYDLSDAYERFAIEPCLRPRLVELRDELLKSGSEWPGSRARFANDVYHSEFPSVYRTPNRPWSQDAWRTLLNGETLGHFDAARVQEFSALHDTIDELYHTQAVEVDAAATLGDLAFAGPLSPIDRRASLKTVARLDELDARMIYLARMLLDEAGKAGIHPNSKAISDQMKQQREYRGPCVKPPSLSSL